MAYKVWGREGIDYADVNDNFVQAMRTNIFALHTTAAVLSGLTFTETGTPDLNLTLAAGTYEINGIEYSYGGGTIANSSASGANPRIDVISINTSGTVTVTAGTAAANPVAPGLPSGECPLALVYRATSDNTISNEDITHWRVLQSTAIGGDWNYMGYRNVASGDTNSANIICLPAGTTCVKIVVSLGGTSHRQTYLKINNASGASEYQSRCITSTPSYANTAADGFILFDDGADGITAIFGEIIIGLVASNSVFYCCPKLACINQALTRTMIHGCGTTAFTSLNNIYLYFRTNAGAATNNYGRYDIFIKNA